MAILGINRANRIYNRIQDRDDDYLDAIMEHTGINYSVDPKSLSNIPAEGPVIFICNHPTGIADGIVMLKILSTVRPDIKHLGNFLGARVVPLQKYLIAVNPFEERHGGNLGGLKQAMVHLSEGKSLLIFPAGEVSTWQKGWHHIADKRWDLVGMKFLRRSGAPIVPVWIDGHNSVVFRMAGKIHPRLRTALLVREAFNKRRQTIRVTIGAPISATRVKDLNDLNIYTDYLRASVDYLKGCRERPIRSIPEIEAATVDLSNIIDRPSLSALHDEMNDIASDSKLFDYSGGYTVYCCRPERIPMMMVEIGRMREITFRRIGEGSMNPIDIDRYDTYYQQLFIWDNNADTLVGAYRLGLGGEIVPKYGLDGFYTHSLFNYTKEMEPIMMKTIELGRSFVTSDYQRKPASLLMLWKGIVHVLMKYGEYRYLVGPVTISGEFQRSSKTIIVSYLRQHHFDADTAVMVRPRTGLDGIDFPIDEHLIRGVDSIDLIGKIVSDIECDERTIPVLIKKYLQMNSHVLGFNVDHTFCDALDALMLLDLLLVPEEMIHMLSKEITDVDVVARFRNVDNG